MTMKTFLLIVDPQNDFCDPKGALFVPGANQDVLHLASMIKKHRENIDHIEVSLDTHHWIHIAHPFFWKDSNNKQPEPFTQIYPQDVEGFSPKWRARCPNYVDYAINYVKKLHQEKRYTLTIWPPHCLIGTWGHNIAPALVDALQYYEESFSGIHYTLKGSNPLTEHYSSIKAEIVHTGDRATDVNRELLEQMANAERVIIGGEALSHCVANTIRDIFKYLGQGVSSKFTILEDACSNIPGFESYGQQFLDEMKSLNVRIAKTTNCFD